MNSFVLADRELGKFTSVFAIFKECVLPDLVNQLSKRFYEAKLYQVQRDIKIQVNTRVDLGRKRRWAERLVDEV